MRPEARAQDPRATRLQNQIRWVSRLSIALGSTQSVEDVYSVLLSGLLSPTGLGYSNALVLDYDATNARFTGRTAIGFESQQAIADLEQELEAEDRILESQREQMRHTVAEHPEQEAAVHNLYSGSQWLTAINRLGMDSESALAFAHLHFDAPLHPPRGQTRPLLSECVHWRTPRAMKASELVGRLPAEILDRVHEDFAIVPVSNPASLLGLLMVDRRHEPDSEIGADDLADLSFFANQSALAISNARLIGDLNRAFQEMKDLDSMKSNFLSTISHELRTPLTAMIGFVDLVAGEKVGTLNATQSTLLGRVQKNTRHMITMVNDLIEVAELQVEGMREHALSPVDPLDVLMKTIPMLDNRRRDKRGEIEPVLPTDGIPRVLTHEDSLRRILFHLLDNALKFSPDGSPVQVVFQTKDRTLEISIHDQGIGIPREKMLLIFEQFYQGDNTMTRSQEGLGLGLSVTRMLATSINATMRVESEVGQGSTFTLGLPLADE